MTGSTRDGDRRFNRSAPIAPSKDGAVTTVEHIRERIQCGTYAVDSEAVAAAILKRLLGNEEEAS
jgi:anti-sigma28 factor (negative regulator of flagellin synthesis)